MYLTARRTTRFTRSSIGTRSNLGYSCMPNTKSIIASLSLSRHYLRFPKNHPLHKIFNRHMLKLSYSCMPNMKSIIASHNKALLSDYTPTPTQQSNKQCNCRTKDKCSLEGKCIRMKVVYQAIITTNRIIRGTCNKLQRTLQKP